METEGKKITVVGLARSGLGAANLLASLGASVTVTDIKTEEELDDFVTRLSPSVRLALGGHPEEVFTSSDMLVLSPGVPATLSSVGKARERGVPVVGELELAYRLAKNGSRRRLFGSGVTFLAITGSNGKSTTTSLLDLILRKSGYRTVLGGNIGNALTEEFRRVEAGGSAYDFVVAEVSSFQLETIDVFRPHIAAILNITPDHMDRYRSLSDYSEAKARIFLNQDRDDFLVLNADDPEVRALHERKFYDAPPEGRSLPRVCWFSRRRKVEGVYFEDGMIHCNMSGLGDIPLSFQLMNAADVKIKGVHNLENAMAAAAMALLAGCPVGAVRETMCEFGGLEHRLEFVRELDGVTYINDSKGTNTGAVLKSLESFRRPVVLIAGGRDKAGDFSVLGPLVSERVKTLVLIGEAAGKMKGVLGGLTETVIAKDLREAVELSREKAAGGDVVLLSPACASFDMFRDFEDRGRQFKEIVMELVNGG
ncbi:MAG: UDP-N-acetylmuramoyl-L-alanine--D-glutamate ligase [Candidatus Sulfobium sp.]|jgi:UDP-N-acetylmuramoylalanine--D-glutamate ligase